MGKVAERKTRFSYCISFISKLFCAPFISWCDEPSRHLLVPSNNRNTRTMCEICSELTIKIPDDVTSLLLILNRFHTLFWWFCCWLWTSPCRLRNKKLFLILGLLTKYITFTKVLFYVLRHTCCFQCSVLRPFYLALACKYGNYWRLVDSNTCLRTGPC